MSIYYFENEAGTYYSENKSRRFIRLKGKAAYEYMKAHHIDQNSLYPTTAKEDNGEPVYIQVREKDRKAVEAENKRDQYHAEKKAKSGIRMVSLSKLLDVEGNLNAEDQVIPTAETSVEDEVAKLIECEMLHRALKTLTDNELRIIYHLFFDEKSFSDCSLSRFLDVPRSTLNCQKRRAYSKLKKFFNKN